LFCSLIAREPQLIPPRSPYVALRFDEESTDVAGWHRSNDLTDPDSALIVPDVTAVGLVAALVFWEPATLAAYRHFDMNPHEVLPVGAAAMAPRQFVHRFTRNPYQETLVDSTCTNDRVPTPGSQFHTFSWPMTVRKGQPLALMVGHDAGYPMMVTLAEFKVWVPTA
jgi:hypothetical protein